VNSSHHHPDSLVPCIVVDSNVFVSALVYRGKPGIILDMVVAGFVNLIYSSSIQYELERVLTEKFFWARGRVKSETDPYWSSGRHVDPRVVVDACVDPDDNRILECAVEGQAQFIVTGDKDLLRMQSFRGIAIVTPAEFLDRLAGRRNPEP
jgi:uncharacterized protein